MAYQSFQKPQGSNTGSSMGQQAGSAQGGPMAGNQNQMTDQGAYGGWGGSNRNPSLGVRGGGWMGAGGFDNGYPGGVTDPGGKMYGFGPQETQGPTGGGFASPEVVKRIMSGNSGGFPGRGYGGGYGGGLFAQLMQRMQSGQGNTGIMMPQSQGGFLDAFKNMPPPAQQVRPGIWLRPGENEADFQFGGKYGPTPFAPRNTGIAGGMGIPQMPDFSKFTRPGGMGAGFPGGGPIPGAPPQGPGTPIEMGPAPRTGPDVYNPTTNPTGKTLPYDIPQDNISGGDQLQMSKQLQDMMSGNNMRKMF